MADVSAPSRAVERTTTTRCRPPTSATVSCCGSDYRISTPAGRATSRPATTGSCRIFRSPPRPDGRPIVAQIRVEYTDAEGFTRPLEGSAAFPRLRNRRCRHRPLDADRSQRRQRRADAGASRPLGVRPLPDRAGEPGADDD